MARVFFVTGSKGGVGKSVGAIALLDYFEMRNRQVSLVETDTANPDVGKAYQKSVKSFSLVNLDENEGWLDLLDIVDASKDDEVVAVVADGGGDGAALEAEAVEQADGDIARRLAVPLDDGDEAEIVAFEMGLPVVGRLEPHDDMLEHDAGQLGANGVGVDRAGGQVGRQLQRRRQLDRVIGGVGIAVAAAQRGLERRRDLALLDHQLAAVPGVDRLEVVVEQDNVGAAAAAAAAGVPASACLPSTPILPAPQRPPSRHW